MDTDVLTITPQNARRLFITKQHLVGNNIGGNFREKITNLVRDIAYVQWDPVTVVAPSHLISIWSRLGNFNWAELDRVMWEDKDAFLHWTPIAVLVLTEDYPIFNALMKGYPESLGRWWRSHISTATNFIDSHKELKEQVIGKLREGPAEIKQFRSFGKRGKSEDGWSSGNEVTTLLHHLHMMGKVMVSGHAGNQNLWSLTEDFLPDWADRDELEPEKLERLMAQRALKPLGIAPAFDIVRYFVRGRYWNLEATLEDLENEGKISRICIEGEKRWKKSFIHSDDIRLLDKIEADKWEPSLKLISPFDNLITIRERTRRLFNFDYILEQFVPKEKRKFGTYVLPILWGDSLVGRVDAKLDKERNVLKINSVYAEDGFRTDLEIPELLLETLEGFSSFLGSEKVEFGKQKPEGWAKFLN